MLDARVDSRGKAVGPDEDGTPFPIAVLTRYMEGVISGAYKGELLQDFVERILPHLDEIDALLQHQRSSDVRFMGYSIFRNLFDEQQQVLLTKKALILLICGRRWGKTTAFASWLVDRAISHDKGCALYLGRTAKSAFDMIWSPIRQVLDLIGIPYTPHIATQQFELSTGVKIMVRGRATKEDLENLRGNPYFAAAVDEVQSDPPQRLRMLHEEILEPAGRDFEDSQIILGGTPSRIPGNYAEELYQSERKDIARFNGNMSSNPHMPKSSRDLEKVRKEKGFSENDPTWLREYVGVIGSYDMEALVFRYGPKNNYTDADLASWIAAQPPSDLFFSGGIDYGFDDFDSAVIVLASMTRRERWKVYGYKGNRSGITDFAGQMKLGIQRITANPLFAKLDRQFTWFCDTEGLGKKITYEFASQFGMTVAQAYQGQPDVMLEMLQDEVKGGWWKVPAPQTVADKQILDPVEDEAKYIVFARDDADRLTRRIDDEICHPEITKSVLYAMRYVWLRSKAKMGDQK